MIEGKSKGTTFQDNYENEKNELLEFAIEKFGSDFLSKLEELAKYYNPENDPNYYKYTLKISNIGAFNAC